MKRNNGKYRRLEKKVTRLYRASREIAGWDVKYIAAMGAMSAYLVKLAKIQKEN